jgi:UPF0176 protein
MSNFNLYAFYKFVELNDNEELKPHFLCLMKKFRVYGTIILASEGLNGTVCAEPENIAAFWAEFTKDERWSNIRHTITFSDAQAFGKMKVKLRKEIVTMGIPSVKANEQDETHIDGNTWNQIIENPKTLVIDTRNDYEYELGSFKNAINPKTDCFRDFPAYVERELMAHKDRPIAMFCTGGVRCEKSTQYLKELGFKEVYQLDGGIITYLQNVPQDESLWQGECFVFDDRVTVVKKDCSSN